ncbi:hypothetical protein SNE40_010589 [Patella caerulea]|uniref:Amine oxidase domain-containing protein n=1 Tax=Patella caerulea TaxID=87958 RepID=A0AAN8JTR4_PATCE
MASKRKSEVKVVIIGAGIAGLSAAQHLQQNGFQKITILEASDRIGGRIHTMAFGKTESDLVDLGAQWIHGEGKENSVYRLAKKYGMLKPLIRLEWGTGVCCNEEGKEIRQELVDDAIDKGFEIETELEKVYRRNRHLSEDELTIQDFYNKRFDQIVATDFPEVDREDAKSVFNYFLNLMRFDNGDDLRHLCSRNVGQYRSIGEKEDVCLPYGFQSVINALLRLMTKVKIILECAVDKIIWIDSKNRTNDVKMICADGTEFIADHVIVTCSLGYLQKYHENLFEPALPENKSQALYEIGYGTVNKIFLYYDEPFWTKGQGTIRFAWTDKNRDINSADEWYKAIHAFDEPHNNAHVLVGSVVGEEGKYIENLDKDEVSRICTQQIRMFLNDDSIPAPRDVLVTKWCSDKWSCGSYSYMKQESSESRRNDLSQPLYNDDNKPVVLFAGEAYHKTRYSTTDGARSSGIDQAQMLVNFYTNQCRRSF